MRDLGKLMVIAGLLLVAAGAAVMLLGRFGAGRLPGDIVVRRGNFTFYFPLMTSILLSVGLSLLLWFLNRR